MLYNHPAYDGYDEISLTSIKSDPVEEKGLVWNFLERIVGPVDIAAATPLSNRKYLCVFLPWRSAWAQTRVVCANSAMALLSTNLQIFAD